MTFSSLIIPELNSFIEKKLINIPTLVRETNPYVTFCYYGRNFKPTIEFQNYLRNRILSLSEGERTVTILGYSILKIDKKKVVVLKLCFSRALIELRQKIYDKYDIIDPIVKYKPHIRIGTISKEPKILPIILQYNFIVTDVEFH